MPRGNKPLIVLTAENLQKSYSEHMLLDEVSITLKEGDRVGVIGINGTGKTTLLKLLAGLERPDGGSVIIPPGVRVHYLPQNPVFDHDLTILEQVLLHASAEEREMQQYEAKSILTKLGLADFDRPVQQLSGGERRRVAIAAALATPCELLILDEPTNHIDSDMVLWMEAHLKKYRGALVMVTHDRYFLDRIANQIVEIDKGKLYTYAANYTQYLQLKAQREEMALASERKLKSLYQKELEWIQRGARARSTKSRFRVERFEALSDRDIPGEEDKLKLSTLSTRLGRKTIELSEVNKAWGDRTMLKDFSHIVLRDARTGIVGPNGCGKSTLLKLIAGRIAPDSGEITHGETVKIGFFTQESEDMDPSLRAIDYIRSYAENIQTPEGVFTASQMMERFLFPGYLQYTPIGRLSGGERRRLYLLRILMEAPNILLLDEPTNDLDIQTLVVLEEYLDQFDGAVVVVSHDRYFLDRVTDHIFAFAPGGQITQYVGGYSEYEQARRELLQKESEATSKKVAEPSTKPQSKKLKFSFNEQREYDGIQQAIEDLEQQLSILQQSIDQSASDYTLLQQLLEQQTAVEQQLEEKMERWVYLSDLAERIANQ